MDRESPTKSRLLAGALDAGSTAAAPARGRSGGRIRDAMGADRDAPLLDGIKAKNRAKRDAFAEFDRLRHDR